MATRFFKKLSPSTPVVLGDGRKIAFKTLNNIYGYHATNEEYVANEFLRFMRADKYGLSEIAFPEFDSEYVQKKSTGTPRKPFWREELSPSSLAGILPNAANALAAAVESAAVVEKPSIPKATVADPGTATPVVAPTVPDFKPATGRRKKSTATVT